MMQFRMFLTLFVILTCSIRIGCSQEDSSEEDQQSFGEADFENKCDVKKPSNPFIDGLVKQSLEVFRKIMKEGNSEWNIPILDPFQPKAFPIDIDHPIAKIKGSLDDLRIEDLSTFELKDISSSFKSLHLEVLIPAIRITKGLYDINGTIGGFFHIFGKGPFNMTLYNVNAIVDCEIQYENPFKLTLKSLDVQVKLEKSECYFENIEGGGILGKILNELISDHLPQMLDLIWPEIEPPLTKKLMPVVNDILQKILDQILQNR